jgi:hypothetical protein
VRSAKNYVILFLALTTVVGAAFAWRQYQELIALRAAVLNSEADWQKRLHTADQQRTELETKVATLEKKTEEEEKAIAADDPPSDRPAFRRGGNREGFRELMESPTMQKLMAIEQKGRLDSRYAALFKALALTPEQLDKFKNLLVEKRTSMVDVMSAAREQGINPRSNPDAFKKLVTDAQAEIDAGIRDTLGDAGFAQYENYEKTMPQRNIVDQLAQRLSYSSTPLTDAQAEQMVQILASTAAANRTTFNGAPVPAIAARAGFGGSQINEAAINQSLGVLAGPQVDALKELQQEQQAQAEFSAAMRRQFQNNRRGGGTTPRPGG